MDSGHVSTTTEAGASVEQRVRKGRRYNFHKILLRFSQFFYAGTTKITI